MRQSIRATLAVPILTALLAVAGASSRVSAQEVAGETAAAAPPGGFTFKRVTPPKPGQKRITIQIAPEDLARQQALPKPRPKDPDAAAPRPAAASPGHYAWYWEAVSPRLEDSGPGRLQTAILGLTRAPGGGGVSAPRLDTLMGIAQAHQADILMTTAGSRVSPALVLAVISVESAGRVDAVSHAGAAGLMQLMPATAARFGVTDRANAGQNIKGGVAYLDFLMKKFAGDPVMVLAGYNAGENAVDTHGGVPPYAETRDYVPKVLAAFEVARSLCKTRPELVSDGCVFSFPS